MGDFELLTLLLVIVTTSAFLVAVIVHNDPFHPYAYIMPMVAFLYAYLPFELESHGLFAFTSFNPDDLARVQILNLLSVVALVLGIWSGAKKRTVQVGIMRQRLGTPGVVDRAFKGALLFGGAGILAFAVSTGNVGGLYEAYSVVKGGGTAESGYVRDAIFWCIPAVAMMAFCIGQDGVKGKYVVPAAIFALPMLIHGLLGARRGPTFIAFAVIVCSWYLSRNQRPSWTKFLAGGAVLGLSLLAIVTFREEFRLGSDLFYDTSETVATIVEQFQERRLEQIDRTLGGNEFVYGTSVVLTFEEQADYYWGKRLLTILFIRPIPRQIWPTKYEDVGMDRYLVNVGLGHGDGMRYETTLGAAPGFVADLFAEFAWGAIVVCFLVGCAYGRVWRNAVWHGGYWMILYVLMIVFSIFLILQSMEAIVYRLTFTAVPLTILWYAWIQRTFDIMPQSAYIRKVFTTGPVAGKEFSTNV